MLNFWVLRGLFSYQKKQLCLRLRIKCLDVSATEIVGQGKIWICTELYIQRSLPAQAPCALMYPTLVSNRFLFLYTGFVLLPSSGWQKCRQINSSETPAASSLALILVLSMLELPRIWHTFYTSFPSFICPFFVFPSTLPCLHSPT